MDVLEALFTRRSIRKYAGAPIDEDELHTILRAGFYAPSARNQQPWHFLVVRDPARLQTIVDGHPFARMLTRAGCAVIVCGDTSNQNINGFLIQDCAAATENILLAAHGMGLGGVWVGIYPIPEFMQLITSLFNLPEHIQPVTMIALGHKDEERESLERYDPEKVHFNTW